MKNPGVYLKAFTAFFIWSFFGPIFNKSSFDAFQNVFLMSSLASLWLIIIISLKKELASLKKLRLSPLILCFAVVSGFSGTMWLKSLTLIPVAQALFLFSSVPLFALFIELTILKERAKFFHLIAIAIGIIGIFIILANSLLITKAEAIISIGVLLVLLGAFLTAIQGILIKKLGNLYPFEIVVLILVFSQSVVSAFFAFQLPWNVNGYSITTTLFMSIFSAVIGLYLYVDALKLIKVSTIRLIGYSEVFLGAIWGIVFLSQPLLPITIIGGLIILLASYLAAKSEEE